MPNLNKTVTTQLISAFFTANAAMADTVNFKSGGYEVRQVNFISHGANIVGTLFSPSGNPAQKPAVVILGPFGSIKEQSPLQYATRNTFILPILMDFLGAVAQQDWIE